MENNEKDIYEMFKKNIEESFEENDRVASMTEDEFEEELVIAEIVVQFETIRNEFLKFQSSIKDVTLFKYLDQAIIELAEYCAHFEELLTDKEFFDKVKENAELVASKAKSENEKIRILKAKNTAKALIKLRRNIYKDVKSNMKPGDVNDIISPKE